MRIATVCIILLSAVCICCGQKSKDGPEAPYLKVINANCSELQKIGRVAKGFDCATLIGRYGWYSHGSGYFGTYVFYPPAFEQAKRGWWGFHGTVIEGNDELWIEENEVNRWSSSDGQSGHDPYGIRFDDTVIGRTISMNMSYVNAQGEYKYEDFSAKIIGIIDDGANLKLNKRAPHHAEQWRMSLPPADFVDMCDCVNNFSPFERQK